MASPPAPPLTTWQIPQTDGEILTVTARSGEVTVVVGARGSGKSALGVWFAQRPRSPAPSAEPGT